jgi:uncharacterized membrane protein YdjX (TVP38/TMEM64 family)
MFFVCATLACFEWLQRLAAEDSERLRRAVLLHDDRAPALCSGCMDSDKRPRAWLVLLSTLLVPIVPFIVIGELPGERWLQAAPAHGLSFGAAGAGLLVLDILLPIPSSIVGALLGARLGFALGFAWTWGGLCIGHAIGFGIGRLAPTRLANQYPRVPSLALVFVSRPVPVLAEAVAIAAGVERLPALSFLASASLGNALYAAAITGSGATLLPAGLSGAKLIIPFLIPVLGYAIWTVRARHTRSS